MQYKVDSYILEYVENEDKYYITFLDSVNNRCKIEITEEVFEAYIDSKKQNTKAKNETSRYIEHLELTDEQIYNRLLYTQNDLESEYLHNLELKKLTQALDQLTKTQYRRLMLNIVGKVSIRDIAKIENVNKNQVEKSIKLGNKKIKKFFQN